MWLAIGIAKTTIAQKNFLEGYIITENSDTIQGEINYQNWERNPKQIEFRNAQNSEPKEYSPKNIHGFYVNGEYYKSARLWIDNSEYKIDRLTETYNQKRVLQEVFLSTLVAGTTNLYFLKDEDFRNHFFYEQDTISELSHNRYLKKVNDRTTIVYPRRYRGQLLLYTKGCGKLQSQIHKSLYKSKDFIKIITAYNKCISGENLYVKKKETLKVRYSLFGAVAKNGLNFIAGEGSSSPLAEAEYKGSVNFNFGGGLEIVLLRNRQRWSIYNEIGYRAYQANASWLGRYGFDWGEIKSEFDFAYLKVGNLLRYTHPGYIIRPFINIGIFNAFAIRNTNTNSLYVEPQENPTVVKPALKEVRNHEQGLIVGAGAIWKHIGLECRFEKGNGMTSFKNINSVTKSFQFLVSYNF